MVSSAGRLISFFALLVLHTKSEMPTFCKLLMRFSDTPWISIQELRQTYAQIKIANSNIKYEYFHWLILINSITHVSRTSDFVTFGIVTCIPNKWTKQFKTTLTTSDNCNSVFTCSGYKLQLLVSRTSEDIIIINMLREIKQSFKHRNSNSKLCYVFSAGIFTCRRNKWKNSS